MNFKQMALLFVPPLAVLSIWQFQKSKLADLEDNQEKFEVQQPVVTSVIDGDTFDMGGQRFRLWGIDAPELKQKCYDDKSFWMCGEIAAQRLRDAIIGKPVVCSNELIDRDGREIARCYLEQKDISLLMVESGWAVDWPKHSKGEYKQSETAARASGLGIFGRPVN